MFPDELILDYPKTYRYIHPVPYRHYKDNYKKIHNYLQQFEKQVQSLTQGLVLDHDIG